MNPAILQAAIKDDAHHSGILKKELTANGFKHTRVAANIMLNEMEDLGLEPEAKLYWQAIAAVHLQ